MSENKTPHKLSPLERAKAATRAEIERKQAGTQTSSGSDGMGRNIPFSSGTPRNQNGGEIARLRAQLGEIEIQMQALGPLMAAKLACQKTAIENKIRELEGPSREIGLSR